MEFFKKEGIDVTHKQIVDALGFKIDAEKELQKEEEKKRIEKLTKEIEAIDKKIEERNLFKKEK